MKVSIFVLLTLSFMALGCSRLPREPGFEDVRALTQDWNGLRIHWRQGTEADPAVVDAVSRMLEDELTLEEAVQIALLNNARLQGVYEDLAVSHASLVQAGLLNNPIFDAAITFPLDGGSPDLDFAIVQSFLEVFFIPIRKRVAASQYESVKLRVAAAILDVALETRIAYYRVVAGQQIVEMREQVVQSTSASVDLAQRLHDAGNIRSLDLANENALHEQARQDLATAQLHAWEARQRLNRLMGVWGREAQWTVTSRLPDPPAELEDLSEIEREAVTNSLDLSIARQEIESFGSRLGLTRAASLVPVLELGAVAEREEGEWEVGPAVELPIPLMDQGQARVATARAELRRRQQWYIATAVEVRIAAQSAAQKLVAAQQVAEHYRDVVLPLRSRILQETQLQYNAMQTGAFELLFAKQQQINAGERYIESLRDYWFARAELEQVRRGRIPVTLEMSGPASTGSRASDGLNQPREGGH